MLKPKKNTCQDCKKHKNNPSFCKEHNEYVGRKHAICKAFVKK